MRDMCLLSLIHCSCASSVGTSARLLLLATLLLGVLHSTSTLPAVGQLANCCCLSLGWGIYLILLYFCVKKIGYILLPKCISLRMWFCIVNSLVDSLCVFVCMHRLLHSPTKHTHMHGNIWHGSIAEQLISAV